MPITNLELSTCDVPQADKDNDDKSVKSATKLFRLIDETPFLKNKIAFYRCNPNSTQNSSIAPLQQIGCRSV